MTPRGPKKVQKGVPGRMSRANTESEIGQKNRKLVKKEKQEPRGRRENNKKCKKPMAPIDRRGLKTGNHKKYGFPCVKISFFKLARTRFFSKKINVCQAFWKRFGPPGGSRGIFKNFGGGQGEPMARHMLLKRGLRGALGAPRDEKIRNGDEKCIFKIVKISWVFIAFLER